MLYYFTIKDAICANYNWKTDIIDWDYDVTNDSDKLFVRFKVINKRNIIEKWIKKKKSMRNINNKNSNNSALETISIHDKESGNTNTNSNIGSNVASNVVSNVVSNAGENGNDNIDIENENNNVDSNKDGNDETELMLKNK